MLPRWFRLPITHSHRCVRMAGFYSCTSGIIKGECGSIYAGRCLTPAGYRASGPSRVLTGYNHLCSLGAGVRKTDTITVLQVIGIRLGQFLLALWLAHWIVRGVGMNVCLRVQDERPMSRKQLMVMVVLVIIMLYVAWR